MRPLRGGNWRSIVWLFAGLAVIAVSACTEDTLTGVDPDAAPGEARETIEIELSSPSDVPAWRDTTFTDYALPSTSSSRLVALSTDLRARVLARFATLPDSVLVGEDRLPVESYSAGRIRLVLDTTASMVPEAGSSVEAYSLARGFVTREATWSEAAAGEPWTTPGGDLGELLGTLQIDSLAADTVFLPLTVDTDSLLQAWLSDDGEPGLALVSDTDGTSSVSS